MPRLHSRSPVSSFLAFAVAIALASLSARSTASPPPPAEPAADGGAIPAWQPRLGRARPLVAVVGENTGTELVDFVVPYGILAESGAADVVALSVAPGPLRMRPALRLDPKETIAAFDDETPQGADYVVVPAVTEDKVADPALLAWLRAQSAKGATIVSICDGALVVANAGLFDGRRATGHWATRERREREHPQAHWLANVRYVADGNVVSSAGVTAAIPTSLALVAAIAGPDAAAATAARLGATGWSARHDSAQFHIGADTVFTYIGNRWLRGRDAIALPVADGVDDVALALTADAWGRTMRSPLMVRAANGEPVRTSHGLVLLPPEAGSPTPARTLAPLSGPSLAALDNALADIGLRYGADTERYVALEIEYPPAYAGR